MQEIIKMKGIFSFLMLLVGVSLFAQDEPWREQYDQVLSFEEGMASVSKDGKWGFVNESGQVVIPIQFEDTGWLGDGLYPVRKGGLWGVIDKKGKLIVPYKYSGRGQYRNGYLDVQDPHTKLWGFIDKTGKVVVPFRYKAVATFEDGLAIVRKNNRGIGFVNNTGKEVIPLQYEHGHFFYKGIAPVMKGEKWGYINKSNKAITAFQYDEVAPFVEGLSLASKGDRYGFVDVSGKEVIPLQYEMAESFSEGLAAVKKDGKWGYINRSGKVVIPFAYSRVEDFRDGTATVWLYDTSIRIEKTGKCVEDCDQLQNTPKKKNGWQANYEFIGETTKGVTLVGNNSQFGLVNKQGKEIIPTKYEHIEVGGGFAFVVLNKKCGLFNLQGKVVLPVIYDEIGVVKFSNEKDFLFLTQRDPYSAVFDKNGKVIIPEALYSYIDTNYLDGGTIGVSINGKEGLFSIEGKELLPAIYDEIDPFGYESQTSAEVIYNGKSFYINREGKCVEDCHNAPNH